MSSHTRYSESCLRPEVPTVHAAAKTSEGYGGAGRTPSAQRTDVSRGNGITYYTERRARVWSAPRTERGNGEPTA